VEIVGLGDHGIMKSGDWEIGRRRDNKKKIKGDEGIRESDDQETGRACSIVPSFHHSIIPTHMMMVFRNFLK
jgi:hypothetical protein